MSHIESFWKADSHETTPQSRACCGCGACESVCPTAAISLKPDCDGFCYPVVQNELCISCRLCEKVCMIPKTVSDRSPLKAYAGYSTDSEIMRNCTSGGFATVLALKVISQNGVVFGVRYKDSLDCCEYAMATTKEEVFAFCGSKYIQSEKNTIHKQVKESLETGKPVLFVGCPCDVAGLKFFLGKAYDNLITLDFSCAGISSPKIASDYILLEEKRKKSKLTGLKTRDKKYGWFVPHMEETFENGKTVAKPYFSSEYGYGFLTFKRLSCLECPYKECRGFSDFRVGDFWGIRKEDPFWNAEGVSFLLTFSEKAEEILNELSKEEFRLFETAFERVYANNDGLHDSRDLSKRKRREAFCERYHRRDLKYACRRTEGKLNKIKRLTPRFLRSGAKRLYHLCVDKK